MVVTSGYKPSILHRHYVMYSTIRSMQPLNRTSIRVGVPQTFAIPKVFHRVFELVAFYAKVQIQWIPLRPTINKSLFDYLLDGDVDCFGDPWAQTAERMSMNISFSVPITSVDMVFVVPRRDPSRWKRAVAIASVFDIDLWILIMITISVLVGIAIVQERIMVRVYPFVHKMSAWRWWLHYTTQHTLPLDSTPTRIKILFLTSSVFTIFSLVLFQGYLLTRLVKPVQYEPDVNSFAQLERVLRDPEVKLDLMYPEFSIAMELANPRTETTRKLNRTLALNPPIFSSKMVDKTQLSEYTIISINVLLEQLILETGDCKFDLVEAENLVSVSYYSYPISPHSLDLKPVFDQVIYERYSTIQAMIRGSERHLKYKFGMCAQKSYDENSRQVGEAIPLGFLLGAFVALGGGLVLGLAVCALECIYNQLRRSYQVPITVYSNWKATGGGAMLYVLTLLTVQL